MSEEHTTMQPLSATPVETTSIPAVEERLEARDLEVFKKIKERAEEAKKTAEKAILQSQNAELQLQNLYYQFVIKYKLEYNKDGIDDDGKILRR